MWHGPRTLTRLALALTVAAPAGLAALLGRAELSGWGWAWAALAVVTALVVAGAAGLVQGAWRTVVRLAPLLGLVAVVAGRLRLGDGRDGVFLVTVDARGHTTSARTVDRLFEERDAAIVGSRLLVALGAVRASEFPRLPEVLAGAYPRLEADAHLVGSPVPSTLLGLQSPAGATAVVVEPTTPRVHTGLLFLHGFGGNFALQCTEVARPVRASTLTICPSTGTAGAWWTKDGEATVRAAVAHLRSRGVHTVVLAGLSNGGAGAALLAPRLGGEVDGLVLLSGVASEAPSPRVPTLVIQGRDDGMMTTAHVRRWVAAHRARSLEYVELPGTHFVLLEQREAVADALRSWVERLPRR